MRKVIYALAGLLLLAHQTAAAQAPVVASATGLNTYADEKTNFTLTLNTTSSTAIDVVDTRPNFDADVIAPLRARQAAREAEAKAAATRARAKKTVAVKAAAVKQFTGDVWEALRNCEAGGDYAKNTGNGYFGAYQYNLSTWANYGGYARPDLAPPAVQDAKARETQARRGWSPWPTCARKLGLL